MRYENFFKVFSARMVFRSLKHSFALRHFSTLFHSIEFSPNLTIHELRKTNYKSVFYSCLKFEVIFPLFQVRNTVTGDIYYFQFSENCILFYSTKTHK